MIRAAQRWPAPKVSVNTACDGEEKEKIQLGKKMNTKEVGRRNLEEKRKRKEAYGVIAGGLAVTWFNAAQRPCYGKMCSTG